MLKPNFLVICEAFKDGTLQSKRALLLQDLTSVDLLRNFLAMKGIIEFINR